MDREKFTCDDEEICLRFDDKNGKFRMCSTVVLKQMGPPGTRTLKLWAIVLFKTVYVFLKVAAAAATAAAHGRCMAFLRNDCRYTRVAIDRHLHQCSLHFKIEDAPYVT